MTADTETEELEELEEAESEEYPEEVSHLVIVPIARLDLA